MLAAAVRLFGRVRLIDEGRIGVRGVGLINRAGHLLFEYIGFGRSCTGTCVSA